VYIKRSINQSIKFVSLRRWPSVT